MGAELGSSDRDLVTKRPGELDFELVKAIAKASKCIALMDMGKDDFDDLPSRVGRALRALVQR